MRGISPPDPYLMVADPMIFGANLGINGLSVRSAVINPALKTLVLITVGQSQLANTAPTIFVPSNSSVIDNFNIYDGALYSIAGPLVGCTGIAGVSNANVASKIADLLVTNGKFDRVIIVPIPVGGTQAVNWTLGGGYDDRVVVAMRRLAARGITPNTTGVTFAMIWGDGESDGLAGTSAVSYTASFNAMLSIATGAGFSGRVFVTRETWFLGTTYATIQGAQTALVNGTTIFSGGDWDSLDATNRQADNTHWNDTGLAAAALLTYNAMHASGAPY